MTGKRTIHDQVQHLAFAECVRDLATTTRMLADLVAVMADRIEAIEKQPEKKAADEIEPEKKAADEIAEATL